MTIRTTFITTSLIAASLVSGAAHAALEGRDLNGSLDSFEAYYDTDLDITWLADANVNGQMNWADANTWAANLSFTDGTNVYADWRLPTTLQPDASCGSQSGGVSGGYGCTGSEMGHLYFTELGNLSFYSATGAESGAFTGGSDPDLAKFTNLQAYLYWSATEFAPNTSYAWYFLMTNGDQGANGKNAGFYALAVSPGDVGAVPEADTWAMLLAGLGLVGVATRRRRG